jgi:mannose-6-phosphate isomerase
LVGEIWFDDPADLDPELLIKFLFTSERLSIQVHPDDQDARESGYRRGKDEAWFILSAEPGASIALGPKRAVSADELRAAALNGGIESLMDWRPVQAGDFIYSPAGTIHAIGPGLSLVEVQQNLDLTYRLYDYGRPRDLHLDDGIRVAQLEPFEDAALVGEVCGREVLAAGAAFVIERWRSPFDGIMSVDPARPVWLIPLTGGARHGNVELQPGSVWRADDDTTLSMEAGADLLAAYAGATVQPRLQT